MTTWTMTVGWTLVHFLWEGTLIALAAAMALRLLCNASAQARYVTACAALVLALLAPLGTAPTLAAVSMLGTTPAPVAVEARPVPSTLFERGAVLASSARASVIRFASRTGTAASATSPISLVAMLWAAGVFVLTLRLGLGWWRVRRLHATALAQPASSWLEPAMRIAAKLRLSRAIHVVDSRLVDTPTVVGWLKPVILLPVAALANLPPGQVQAILAHELAHIRRHDFVVNLLQTIAETVLFYHPAIWWLSNRIRAEREHCCDDIAVDICGDPLVYVEALTGLASWAASVPPLAMAATGGALLTRVRRLLQRPAAEPRRPKAPVVIAGAILIVVLAGVRWIVVAQGLDGLPPLTTDRGMGPIEINRLVGYELFPGPAHYATDDPRGAQAWDVTISFPGGETTFSGFTARGLVRYAYDLGDMPVMDGPAWLDVSQVLRAHTSAIDPDDFQFREAIRAALEGQFGIALRRDVRNMPVLALMQAQRDQLGPNLHPSAVECIEGRRARPVEVPPSVKARGPLVPACGIDDSFTGPVGYRVTISEFARSLRGWVMEPLDGRDSVDREIIDGTGLTGEFDFRLHVGFLPFAAIATAHPNMAADLAPLGVRTLPAAIEEQLGLRLIPTEAPREVMVIAAGQRKGRP